jgi:Fur family ferric uptake transcriptional regulator
MGRTSTIMDALERGGFRLTLPRRRLAALISERDAHFTADDLVREARDRRLGVARATIFRTLDVLTTLGVVERLDLPSGEHAFVACEPSHHHHIVCTSCGRATDVPDRELRAALDGIGRETGYRVDRHRVELFGLCPRCLAEETA